LFRTAPSTKVQFAAEACIETGAREEAQVVTSCQNC
jgi:hypothetical protein